MYKEASFPVTYCQTEVKQILRAIRSQRSIAVVGLAGMGKSNILRFIAAHPRARARYLDRMADDVIIVLLDCNLIENCAQEAAILQAMAVQLASVAKGGKSSTSMPARQTLEKALEMLPPAQLPVFIVDRFDLAAATLPSSFYNILRGLRDRRAGRVSFVLGLRRLPENLYELGDLFVNPCYVGPLNRQDSLDSLRRDERRIGHRFKPIERERVLAISGRHPALRKNVAELAAAGSVSLVEEDRVVIAHLLEIPLIPQICGDLWNDLTTTEQTALWAYLSGAPTTDTEVTKVVTSLRQYGLLDETSSRQPALFSPLFEAFVRQQSVTAQKVIVVLEPPLRVRLKGPLGDQWLKLTPVPFKLLECLARSPGGFGEEPSLLKCVYGRDVRGLENRSQTLGMMVHRIREQLDPPLRQLTNDPSYSCMTNLRGAYQLNSRTASGTEVVFGFD